MLANLTAILMNFSTVDRSDRESAIKELDSF